MILIPARRPFLPFRPLKEKLASNRYRALRVYRWGTPGNDVRKWIPWNARAAFRSGYHERQCKHVYAAMIASVKRRLKLEGTTR